MQRRRQLQSGAAMKEIQAYGPADGAQQLLHAVYGMLGGLSAQGAQAGSAIAGVGSNFGNTAANINGQMGNAINSGAQNIGNLQLANGQNQANMYGQIGGALGKFGSSFMPMPPTDELPQAPGGSRKASSPPAKGRADSPPTSKP
jgi:hypothetical protein